MALLAVSAQAIFEPANRSRPAWKLHYRLWPAYLMQHGPFWARLVFSNEKACLGHEKSLHLYVEGSLVQPEPDCWPHIPSFIHIRNLYSIHIRNQLGSSWKKLLLRYKKNDFKYRKCRAQGLDLQTKRNSVHLKTQLNEQTAALQTKILKMNMPHKKHPSILHIQRQHPMVPPHQRSALSHIGWSWSFDGAEQLADAASEEDEEAPVAPDEDAADEDAADEAALVSERPLSSSSSVALLLPPASVPLVATGELLAADDWSSSSVSVWRVDEDSRQVLYEPHLRHLRPITWKAVEQTYNNDTS